MKSGASDPFAQDSDGAGDSDDGDHADGTLESQPEAESRAETADSGSTDETDDRDPSGTGGASASSARTVSDDGRRDRERESRESPDVDAAIDDVREAGATSSATSGNDEPADSSARAEDDDGLTRSELPYILRRDRVKDERPEVHQLFVQEGTHERAVDAERDLQDRLDDDLSRTDAREAIYLAGMSQLDDAEAILREWGYDL